MLLQYAFRSHYWELQAFGVNSPAQMAAVRDSLCDLGRLEIPRPKCQGMQFVATRGKQGFYRTIRANGAQFGLNVKPQGPRRPMLSNDLFQRPETVKEEDSDGTVSPVAQQGDDHRSSYDKLSSYSVSPQPPACSPAQELAPDYPSDYVPPHMRSHAHKTVTATGNGYQQRF